MSVMFQLFHAADLQNLSQQQFDDLKGIISNALNTSDRVADAVRERAYEVFHQLTSPDIVIKGPEPRDRSQQLLNQLFCEDDLQHLDAQKIDILRIAMSCEAAASYEALEAVLDVVSDAIPEKFPTLTQPPRRDPDAGYSPFNRNGPIYPIYHPEPPSSGTATAST